MFSVTSFASSCRCQPNEPCWPKEKDWQQLVKHLTGKLVQPSPLLASCQQQPTGRDCANSLQKTKNPFYLQSMPAGTENQGWLNAWAPAVSTYAIEAENSNDVATGVNFAAKHNLRLVIKGAGHDYLGRSSAPNSLLIWTHHMNTVAYNKAFVPAGCTARYRPTTAVTVGAGSNWLSTYNVVTNQHNRYVQGGGCTTVGAAGGFTQGGGFGSFSRRYGTGAGGILQAEVVLANGKTVIANQCQNPDLFWALRGGGGGTFGVVTKMTLQTHPLPKQFGIVSGSITAHSDVSYQALINKFLIFMRTKLLNPSWGEKINFTPTNSIRFTLVSSGLTKSQMKLIWQPMQAWLKMNKKNYDNALSITSFPANKMWSYDYLKRHYPSLIQANTLANAKKGQYWWGGDSEQVYTYYYTYQSWWLPQQMFTRHSQAKTAQLFFKASRLAPFSLHINKGLANASQQAIILSKQTSMNPSALNASALVLMSASSNSVYPSVKGKQPNLKQAQKKIDAINAAMNMFRRAAPNSGAYANEADYFEKNWQKAFWGRNYQRLYHIKQQVDPNGLFYCHHCVGSELWSKNGQCRLTHLEQSNNTP